MKRARPPATSFLINTNTGDPIINPHSFGFPFQAGADVGLVRYGDLADLDLRYFGVNQSSASQGPFYVGPGTGLSGAGGGSPAPLILSSSYVFSLNSAEANLRRNLSVQLAKKQLSLDRLRFNACPVSCGRSADNININLDLSNLEDLQVF